MLPVTASAYLGMDSTTIFFGNYLNSSRIPLVHCRLGKNLGALNWQPVTVEWSFDTRAFDSYLLSVMSLPPSYSAHVTTAPTHNLTGRDSTRLPGETESSLTDTLGVAETSKVPTSGLNYSKRQSGNLKFNIFHLCEVYYRIYAEDGAIPSMTPITPGDPFVGRIKARSVPPPRTVKAVKCSIAKVENIKDREDTSLFLTSYSESPMDDADKVTILNGIGPGSTPLEPLALVAKMSDSERSDLESGGRDGLASATVTEPGTTPPGIRYLKSIHHFLTFFFLTSRLLWEVYYLLVGRGGLASATATEPDMTPPNYSKRLSGRFRFSTIPPSHLCEFC